MRLPPTVPILQLDILKAAAQWHTTATAQTDAVDLIKQNLFIVRSGLGLPDDLAFVAKCNALTSLNANLSDWLKAAVTDFTEFITKTLQEKYASLNPDEQMESLQKQAIGTDIDHTVWNKFRSTDGAEFIHAGVSLLEDLKDAIALWKVTCPSPFSLDSGGIIVKCNRFLAQLSASQQMTKRTDKPRKLLLEQALKCASDKEVELAPVVRAKIAAMFAAQN